MANCGLPGCPSKAKPIGINDSNKSLRSEPPCEGRNEKFKGTCGLPDCRGRQEGAARSPQGQQQHQQRASTSQKNAEKQERLCATPDCKDINPLGREVCLYRGPHRYSFSGGVGALYTLFWATVKKIQTDPYYWSLFKSIAFFIFGLKLYRDLAINFQPERPKSKLPKCRKK